MLDDSETFFIGFRVIDTSSDQDLRSIAQKLRSTAPLEVLRKVLLVHCACATHIISGSFWNLFIRFLMIGTILVTKIGDLMIGDLMIGTILVTKIWGRLLKNSVGLQSVKFDQIACGGPNLWTNYRPPLNIPSDKLCVI